MRPAFIIASTFTALLLSLSACGFEPIHATNHRATNNGENIGAQLQSIYVVTDRSRLGQLLKAEMESQFNPTYVKAAHRYQLRVTLSESEGGVFINPDGTSSRNNVNLNSSYTLTELHHTEIIDRGDINRISSYNLSEDADFATYVAQQDARKRGILEIARAYKLRLSNVLTRPPEQNTNKTIP
jgi:hypothetical protein